MLLQSCAWINPVCSSLVWPRCHSITYRWFIVLYPICLIKPSNENTSLQYSSLYFGFHSNPEHSWRSWSFQWSMTKLSKRRPLHSASHRRWIQQTSMPKRCQIQTWTYGTGISQLQHSLLPLIVVYYVYFVIKRFIFS